MKLRTRYKYSKRLWFMLRLNGHNFYFFTMSDVRSILNYACDLDPLIGSIHIR